MVLSIPLLMAFRTQASIESSSSDAVRQQQLQRTQEPVKRRLRQQFGLSDTVNEDTSMTERAKTLFKRARISSSKLSQGECVDEQDMARSTVNKKQLTSQQRNVLHLSSLSPAAAFAFANNMREKQSANTHQLGSPSPPCPSRKPPKIPVEATNSRNIPASPHSPGSRHAGGPVGQNTVHNIPKRLRPTSLHEDALPPSFDSLTPNQRIEAVNQFSELLSTNQSTYASTYASLTALRVAHVASLQNYDSGGPEGHLKDARGVLLAGPAYDRSQVKRIEKQKATDKRIEGALVELLRSVFGNVRGLEQLRQKRSEKYNPKSKTERALQAGGWVPHDHTRLRGGRLVALSRAEDTIKEYGQYVPSGRAVRLGMMEVRPILQRASLKTLVAGLSSEEASNIGKGSGSPRPRAVLGGDGHGGCGDAAAFVSASANAIPSEPSSASVTATVNASTALPNVPTKASAGTRPVALGNTRPKPRSRSLKCLRWDSIIMGGLVVREDEIGFSRRNGQGVEGFIGHDEREGGGWDSGSEDSDEDVFYDDAFWSDSSEEFEEDGAGEIDQEKPSDSDESESESGSPAKVMADHYRHIDLNQRALDLLAAKGKDIFSCGEGSIERDSQERGEAHEQKQAQVEQADLSGNREDSTENGIASADEHESGDRKDITKNDTDIAGEHKSEGVRLFPGPTVPPVSKGKQKEGSVSPVPASSQASTTPAQATPSSCLSQSHATESQKPPAQSDLQPAQPARSLIHPRQTSAHTISTAAKARPITPRAHPTQTQNRSTPSPSASNSPPQPTHPRRTQHQLRGRVPRSDLPIRPHPPTDQPGRVSVMIKSTGRWRFNTETKAWEKRC